MLAVLENYSPERSSGWRDYVRSRTTPEGVNLDFIGSGDDAKDYSLRLSTFSWSKFFAENEGGAVIERLRTEWKRDYDYVLVDSRTGLSDSSGICTIQMPDLIVMLFAANDQNIHWSERIARSIRKGRSALPYERTF